jgi:hypothetical protein
MVIWRGDMVISQTNMVISEILQIFFLLFGTLISITKNITAQKNIKTLLCEKSSYIGIELPKPRRPCWRGFLKTCNVK